MPKSSRWIFLILAQLILLGIELLTHFDTTDRQIALSLTNIGATVGLLWLDRRLRRQGGGLSLATMLTVLAAVWIDALGNFQHLYGGYWWWDRVTHGFGGLAVSLLFLDVAASRQAASGAYGTLPQAAWFGFLLGQFVAAMYEVSEWLGDWWFATARVRGPYDSPRDLFFNLVGGFVALGIFWLSKRKK